jgi:hypothetical protein
MTKLLISSAMTLAVLNTSSAASNPFDITASVKSFFRSEKIDTPNPASWTIQVGETPEAFIERYNKEFKEWKKQPGESIEAFAKRRIELSQTGIDCFRCWVNQSYYFNGQAPTLKITVDFPAEQHPHRLYAEGESKVSVDLQSLLTLLKTEGYIVTGNKQTMLADEACSDIVLEKIRTITFKDGKLIVVPAKKKGQ